MDGQLEDDTGDERFLLVIAFELSVGIEQIANGGVITREQIERMRIVAPLMRTSMRCVFIVRPPLRQITGGGPGGPLGGG